MAFRILVASDDESTSLVLRMILEHYRNLQVVCTTATGRELGLSFLEVSPDVVLVDLEAAQGETVATVVDLSRMEGMPTRFVGLVGAGAADRALLGRMDTVLPQDISAERLAAALQWVASQEPPTRASQEVRLSSGSEPVAGSQRMPAPQLRAEVADGHEWASGARPQGPVAPQPEGAPAGQVALLREEGGAGDRAITETFAPWERGSEGHAMAEPPRVQTGPARPPGTLDIADTLGSINLVVSPFESFRSLAAFQQALEELEGVRRVKVRRFHRGTLYATVQYDSVLPLEERIKQLAQFLPRVVGSAPGSLELRIGETEGRGSRGYSPATC